MEIQLLFEWFAELEWGILSAQGNLNTKNCLVVKMVHDCQVIEVTSMTCRIYLNNIISPIHNRNIVSRETAPGDAMD